MLEHSDGAIDSRSAEVAGGDLAPAANGAAKKSATNEGACGISD
jgi:hypothetical protein